MSSIVDKEGKRRIVSLDKHKSSVEAKSVEACNDTWYEILSKLPTKSLVISKFVCKAWRDFATHILARHRSMAFLSTRGVFFTIYRPSSEHDDTNKFDLYLIYVSLTTNEIASRIDSPSGNNVNYGYNQQLLGNLTLDLNPMYVNPSFSPDNQMFYAAHKGLILTVHSDGTYQVVNPATKQVLELPKPDNHVVYSSLYGENWMFNHAIINLSSTTACSFLVVRFSRVTDVVDFYDPITRDWIKRRFSFGDYEQLHAGWYTESCVFVSESQTLFIMTTRGHGVAIKFGSLDYAPHICGCYCLSLPKVVRKRFSLTRFGESQGCLYLSHVDHFDGIWIWKHCGVLSADNPWIPLFEISKTTRLCKPVAEERIGKFYDAGRHVYLMGFHPEIEVVFIFVEHGSFFAYDLVKDTLVEIVAGLGPAENIQLGFAHPYTPCLASLEPCLQ